MLVVSGLARGADGAAHRGCLAAGGATVAVLGCGPDVVYPPEHRELAASLCREGALVSELGPGAPPLPEHFPLRNRLISGISLAVVVVEANHCTELLKADTRRPWPTKQRIGGRHGHLSNEATRALLTEVACPHWRRVYLTHISRDCNSRAAVELAFAPVRAALQGCEFSIVCHGETTPVYEFV